MTRPAKDRPINRTAIASRRMLASGALAAAIIALITPATAQSATSSWTPQSKVVEMWSEKRAEHNFHESRVPDYELPDPLVSKSGQTIASALDWVTTGRPALLQLFRENVYGVRPSTDYEITYEEVARSENAFGIRATARQIRATIQVRGKSHSFDFIIAMPRSDAPVPVVVQINNRHLIPLDKAVDEFDPF
jgi:hypothetical protein